MEASSKNVKVFSNDAKIASEMPWGGVMAITIGDLTGRATECDLKRSGRWLVAKLRW